MPTLDVGRVCVKNLGREKGRRCVVVDSMDKNFVLVTGPQKITGVKRRRVNITHLDQTEEKVDIKKGATDEEVMRALEKSKDQTPKPKAEGRRKPP
jgi:large subunit ribosomal protein L14e